MTGITTAGYSGPTGSRAAKFGYRYAAADSLGQQGGRSETWRPLSLGCDLRAGDFIGSPIAKMSRDAGSTKSAKATGFSDR
jgi:hypothetical protein